MRLRLVLCAVLALPTASFAIERTVGSVTNATADINRMMMTPICAASQYVGVDNGRFVCRNIPTCGTGQALSFNGASFTCLQQAVIPAPPNFPTCAAGQALTFNGGLNCVNITAAPPPPSPPPPPPRGEYVEQSFSISQSATCDNDRRAGFTNAPEAGPGLVNFRDGGSGVIADIPGEWDMCGGNGVIRRGDKTYSITHGGGFSCRGHNGQTDTVTATCVNYP